MAYVFLGWSLAVAVGLPLVTFIASRYGWRAAYAGVGLIGVVSFLLLAWRLPAGLSGVPVNLKTWVAVGRNPLILALLLVTTLQTSGQFAVFTFFGPLLAKLTGAGPDAIGVTFAIYGVCGFVGNVIASRIVDFWGAYRTSVLAIAVLLTGASTWALGAGSFAIMATGVAIWGLGFASTNSMQQVRLVAAAPPLASATVSLNTSVLYIGQAVGSGIGGALFAAGFLHEMSYVSMGFIALGLVTAILTGRIAAAKA
jgi:MFS transporter, DHA1 family, inner membrane transport protein